MGSHGCFRTRYLAVTRYLAHVGISAQFSGQRSVRMLATTRPEFLQGRRVGAVGADGAAGSDLGGDDRLRYSGCVGVGRAAACSARRGGGSGCAERLPETWRSPPSAAGRAGGTLLSHCYKEIKRQRRSIRRRYLLYCMSGRIILRFHGFASSHTRCIMTRADCNVQVVKKKSITIHMKLSTTFKQMFAKSNPTRASKQALIKLAGQP